MTSKTLRLAGNIRFNVRLVQIGEHYGPDSLLAHDKIDPLVEFYDARLLGTGQFGRHGQLISRYYASALMKDDTTGLNLDSASKDWRLTAMQLTRVKQWIKEIMPSEEELENFWAKKANHLLVGLRIISVRYMTDDEASKLGWENRPIVFEMSDGQRWCPVPDDDAQNGGSLFCLMSEECLPRLDHLVT